MCFISKVVYYLGGGRLGTLLVVDLLDILPLGDGPLVAAESALGELVDPLLGTVELG